MNILYSIGCVNCNLLEQELKKANIDFTICTDVELMLSKGFKFIPVFETDGKIMNYHETIDWLKGVK